MFSAWFCQPSGNIVRKQCFLVCLTLGNMARKQCFLVCPPLGNMEEKQGFRISPLSRAVARTLIGGGGGCIFIYSGSARLVSFEIKLISNEISRAEPEYMNIHPPISVLATALLLSGGMFGKQWFLSTSLSCGNTRN